MYYLVDGLFFEGGRKKQEELTCSRRNYTRAYSYFKGQQRICMTPDTTPVYVQWWYYTCPMYSGDTTPVYVQ